MAGSQDKDHRRRSVRKASQSSFLISRNAKNELREKVKKISEILKKPENLRTKADKVFVSKNPDIVKTSETNARRLKANKERVLEIEDESALLEIKCLQLAELIKSSKHVVVYTGAGISTAASIPDYRGPNGVWTKLRKGQELSPQDLSDAEPTLTHMSLTTLYRVGKVKHIVSQNVDGLHIRSGFPRHALSEVHGNMFIECCYSCAPHKEFIRLFDVTERTGVHRHTTQRRCRACSGNLTDTIVHFGEKGKLKSPYRWKEAVRAAKKADLILCLGSSLKVLRKYACLWCMDKKPQLRPKLVIVNLQWTPKDDLATIKINGKCDYVMAKVMDLLQYDIPMYKREADPIFTLYTPLRAYELKTTSKKILDVPAQLTKSTRRQRKTKKAVSKQSHRKSQANNIEVGLLKSPTDDIQGSPANSLTLSDTRYKNDVCNITSCNISDQTKRLGTSESSPDHRYPVMRNLLSPASRLGSDKPVLLSSSSLSSIYNLNSTDYSTSTQGTSQNIYSNPLARQPLPDGSDLNQGNFMTTQVVFSDRSKFGLNDSTPRVLDEGITYKTNPQSASNATRPLTECVSDALYSASGESTPSSLPDVVVIDLGKTEIVMDRDRSGSIGSVTSSSVPLMTETSVSTLPAGVESLVVSVSHGVGQQGTASMKPSSVNHVTDQSFIAGLANVQPGHFGGTIKVDLSELGNFSTHPNVWTYPDDTDQYFPSHGGERDVLACKQKEIFPGSETGFGESVLCRGLQNPTISSSKNLIQQSSIEGFYNIYHDHCYCQQNLLISELKSSLGDLTCSTEVVQTCDRQCYSDGEETFGVKNFVNASADKQSCASESTSAAHDVTPNVGVPSCILNMDDMDHLKLKATENQTHPLKSSKGCICPDEHLPHMIILPVNPLLLISGAFLKKQLLCDHNTRHSKAESVLENGLVSNVLGADVVKQKCDKKPSLFKCNQDIGLDTSCLSAFGSYLSDNSGIATGLSTSYVDLTLLSQEAVYSKNTMQVSLSGSLVIMDQGKKDSVQVPELTTRVVDSKISYLSSENNKASISMLNKLLKVQRNKDVVFEDKSVIDPISCKKTVISDSEVNHLGNNMIKMDLKGRENVCINLNKRKHVVAAVPGWFGKGLGLKKKKK